MVEKRQKKQAVKAFEKETFSKDKEVTGAKHTEHRQDNTFSAENQFSANEKPVSNLPRDANHGNDTKNVTSGHNVQKSETGAERKTGNKKKYYRKFQQQQDTSGHNVQKSEAEAEKAFLKENSFMQEEQSEDFDTVSDSTMENKVHVRDTYQRSEEKGKYHKKRVQRENAHKERAKSENRGSPTVEISRQRMILLRRGRRKDLRIRGYRRQPTDQRRTAASCIKQRIRCRRSGSMR